MTDLSATIAVPLPADAVERAIFEYFDLQRRTDGEVALPLRVSLRDFGIPAGLALERDVSVRISRRRDAQNINEEIGVTWQPLDGGPYPVFNGRLIVWSEHRPDESFMELDGSYEPPGGAAGQFFDDAVGHLIAQRTAHQLLESLSEGIIALHRAQAAKT